MKSFTLGVILLVSSILTAQSHFNAVEPTGLPYQIIVTSATIDGNTIQSGTEIGVFDDTLCVGSVVFDGNFNIQIVAWEEAPANNLPGFKVGDPIEFKYWTNTGNEWQEISAEANFTRGDGLFGSDIYSVVELQSSTNDVAEENHQTEKISVEIYPNPAKGNVYFTTKFNPHGFYSIDIYDLLGKRIYSISKNNADVINTTFSWNGKTNDGEDVVSGIYLFMIKTKNHLLSKKFLFIK